MSENNALVQRSMLKQHRVWGQRYGINAADIRPQTLKIFFKLDPNKDSYSVDLSQNGGAQISPIEYRLKDSSLFFANLFGLALLKAPIVASVEYPAGAPFVFYPDKTIFGDAAGTAPLSEAQSLEMVYHSGLTLKTDQTIRLDELTTEIFRSAPDTQSGAAAHPSQALELRDLSSSFFLWGDRKNVVTLQLPGGGNRVNIQGGADSQNYAVLLVGGFEVVNAANSSRVKEFAREVEGRMAR